MTPSQELREALYQLRASELGRSRLALLECLWSRVDAEHGGVDREVVRAAVDVVQAREEKEHRLPPGMTWRHFGRADKVLCFDCGEPMKDRYGPVVARCRGGL